VIDINGEKVKVTVPAAKGVAQTVLEGTAEEVAKKAAKLLQSPTVMAIVAVNPQVAIALRAARALAGTAVGRKLIASAKKSIVKGAKKLFGMF
jgi:hypothetical protein